MGKKRNLRLHVRRGEGTEGHSGKGAHTSQEKLQELPALHIGLGLPASRMVRKWICASKGNWSGVFVSRLTQPLIIILIEPVPDLSLLTCHVPNLKPPYPPCLSVFRIRKPHQRGPRCDWPSFLSDGSLVAACLSEMACCTSGIFPIATRDLPNSNTNATLPDTVPWFSKQLWVMDMCK